MHYILDMTEQASENELGPRNRALNTTLREQVYPGAGHLHSAGEYRVGAQMLLNTVKTQVQASIRVPGHEGHMHHSCAHASSMNL